MLQVDLLSTSDNTSVVHPKDVCSLLGIIIQSSESPLEVEIYVNDIITLSQCTGTFIHDVMADLVTTDHDRHHAHHVYASVQTSTFAPIYHLLLTELTRLWRHDVLQVYDDKDADSIQTPDFEGRKQIITHSHIADMKKIVQYFSDIILVTKAKSPLIKKQVLLYALKEGRIFTEGIISTVKVCLCDRKHDMILFSI